MSSLNLNNCTKKMWCVISPCRLMNIWIYLHKACTKLLQLTVIGWTITLLSKMAGEGFFSFFFLFFLKQYFFVSLFLFLTCIYIVMTCWYIGTGCVFLLFVVVTGCLKCTVPSSQLVRGFRVRGVFRTVELDPLALVSKTLWSSGWLLTTERGS